MKVIRINKKDWAGGLERSRSRYRLYGPVLDANKTTSRFKELADGVEPGMAISKTTLSPKSIVFPHSEIMLEYTTDETRGDCNLMKIPEKNYSPRAVVGIHPCDAAAMLLVRKNFDTPKCRDPYWCNAYEACTFIGLADNEPDSLDFSTSTKSGPFDISGLDVLLVDINESYLAQVITEKGDDWLKTAGFETEAESGAGARIQEMKNAAESKIQSKISFENIKSKSILDLYHASFWEDAVFACINCGACTYVCPTCWCFDIQDENTGKNGKRLKVWDSCMYPLFTMHTTGHNPRGTKIHRTRQRFMHKLKYFLDIYNDGIMCVGCGRCIRSCPVNIDIRTICAKMNS